MRIVVVGGVAGGMSCAARARRLDESAEIIVLERGEHVSFAACGLPYVVDEEITDVTRLLVQTPESLAAALNLDVRTRHEVTQLDPTAHTVTVIGDHGQRTLGYDALVLAPGATPIRPPLPGVDDARTATLRTVEDAVALHERAGTASTAVVVGGGFIGLEAAEVLRRRGLRVSIVEAADHVLPPLEAELAALVTAELHRLGITVHTGAPATAADLAADLVLLAVGGRPDTGFVERAGIACERGAIVVDEHGRTSAPDVWAVGDATLSTDAVTRGRRPVALAGPANRAGRLVADDILRPRAARAIPAAVGTAIVRVGELTVALTGANRSALASTDYRTIHLHPNQHAGYFPGAAPIHLLVHFHSTDGRLLGAQAAGTAGVDKRIDVLATAIRAGMRVGDLIDLDLAYSPPYGQAKDPVNLAGMLGSNVLDGTLRLWYADEATDDSALLLDCRGAAKFASGHLAGSLNIPHTQLREHLDEVRAVAAGRPVRVLCASGLRAAIAHRILAQAGLDSACLSGGILTLRALRPEALVTDDLEEF